MTPSLQIAKITPSWAENGSDTINVNATTNLEINGGTGNDIINVNSNNNTNVQAGSGNDNIK